MVCERTVEQDALWGLDSDGLEEHGVPQWQLHQLSDLGKLLAHTTDIVVANLRQENRTKKKGSWVGVTRRPGLFAGCRLVSYQEHDRVVPKNPNRCIKAPLNTTCILCMYIHHFHAYICFQELAIQLHSCRRTELVSLRSESLCCTPR